MSFSPKLIVIVILILMASIWSAFDWNNGMTDRYNDALRRLRHKEFHEGIRLLKLEAEDGSAIAQFNLGLMNEFGMGVIPNLHYARRWYQQAAALGYAPAMKRLDSMAAEYSQAMLSIVPLAKSGDQLARAQLGFAYLYGLGVQQSFSLADFWCQKVRIEREKQLATGMPYPSADNDDQMTADMLCSRFD